MKTHLPLRQLLWINLFCIATLSHLGCSKSESPEPVGDELSAEVMALIEKGSKVGAVKTYQKEKGLSLADAKAQLEEIVASKGLNFDGPSLRTKNTR